MDFTLYNAKKVSLQSCYSSTLTLLKDLKLKKAYSRLQEDAERLEDERFNLVVIGEFSRGKSTFVNAMLGKNILPSSKEPTTNIISKIVYGDVPQYKLFYKDGKSQVISEEEFNLIKAQSEHKLKNIISKLKHEPTQVDFSNVSYAEISYPLSFCKNQVDVIDTPGTNDLNVGRLEITYNYLRQADAAILMMSATQPLTLSEKNFLVEQVIGNNIRDIFIVVTYRDEVIGEEERVIKHILDNLADVQDFSERIFIVNGRGAWLYRQMENGGKLTAKQMLTCPASLAETGILEFEEALGVFLSEEKGNAKLKKYVSRCNMALKDAERDIRIKKDGLSHSLDDLQERLFVERPKYHKTMREAERITTYLEAQLLGKQTELEQMAEHAASRMKQAAVDAINQYNGDIDALDGDEVKFMVESAVSPVQKQFISDINKAQQEIVTSDVAVAAEELRKIWQDMNFDADALPIKSDFVSVDNIQTSGKEKRNKDDDSLGIAVGSYLVGSFLFGGPVGLLAGVAGWFLSGGSNPFENRKSKITEQVRRQYEKNLKGFGAKIGEQYKDSVHRICLEMRNEVNDRIEEMHDQLQELIEQKEQRQQDIDEVRAQIDKQEHEIDVLRCKLKEVLR